MNAALAIRRQIPVNDLARMQSEMQERRTRRPAAQDREGQAGRNQGQGITIGTAHESDDASQALKLSKD
jgi:hypothetical protein